MISLFLIRESFQHKLDKDLGLYPMVVPLEKIDELRWVHLLGSVQNHVECFDQGDDH